MVSILNSLNWTNLSTLETLEFDDFISPSQKNKNTSPSPTSSVLGELSIFCFPLIFAKNSCFRLAPGGWLPLGDPGIIRNLHIPYSESTPPPSAIQHLPSQWWQQMTRIRQAKRSYMFKASQMLEKSLEKGVGSEWFLENNLGESVAVAASVTSQTFKLSNWKVSRNLFLQKFHWKNGIPLRCSFQCKGSCSTSGSYLVCQVASITCPGIDDPNLLFDSVDGRNPAPLGMEKQTGK